MKDVLQANKKNFSSFFSSQIGRKVLTGVSGLGLVGFVLIHMLGNLSYFAGVDAYNAYTEKLASLGVLLYVVEFGLAAFFIFHIVLGISIALGKRKARPVNYDVYQSAGGQSRQSLSSRSMIITGIILLVFLIFHLKTFKFGTYYETTLDGKPVRDLARLMTETFQNPFYVFGYTAVVVLLALHLRHGVWSAFQSLGATNPRLSPILYSIGLILGLLIAAGFFVLPIWIYFTGGGA